MQIVLRNKTYVTAKLPDAGFMVSYGTLD